MISSLFLKNVVIDACCLKQDSPLLQQASSLTNGFYFRVPILTGLLNYLLWLFLPDQHMRKMLVYPPNTHVDDRAACFCHRKLIDVGYVCSVCLSVFCSFTPICSTCNCTFQFDVNVLKMAKSIRQGTFNLNTKFPTGLTGSQSASSFSLSSSTSQNALSAKTVKMVASPDEFSASNLASQFQDTSISSPLAPMSIGSMSNQHASFEPFESSDSPQPPPQIKIITAVSVKSSSSSSTRRDDPDDSFDEMQ